MIREYLFNILGFSIFIIGGIMTIIEDKLRFSYAQDINLKGYGWAIGIFFFMIALILIYPLYKKYRESKQ